MANTSLPGMPDIDLRYGRRLPGNLRQMGAVGRYVPAPRVGSQQVVITGRITSKVHTAKDQLRYMQHGRPGDEKSKGRDGQPATLFGPDVEAMVQRRLQELTPRLATLDEQIRDAAYAGDSTRELAARRAELQKELRALTAGGAVRFVYDAARDSHQFRMMVSPEKTPEYFLLRPFVEQLMTQMQNDLKRPIDWLAAVHYDTDKTHAHILLRGRDRDGKDLYITNDYLKHGIRYQAMQLATRWLGRENERERVRMREVKFPEYQHERGYGVGR